MQITEVVRKIAVHKAVSDTDYKSLSLHLPSGSFLVDTTVRVAGAVRRGAPYEQRVASKANPWALLARALSKLNSATIDSLVEEAIGVDAEEASAIKEAAEAALDRIIGSTKTQMPGRITATLALEFDD